MGGGVQMIVGGLGVCILGELGFVTDVLSCFIVAILSVQGREKKNKQRQFNREVCWI